MACARYPVAIQALVAIVPWTLTSEESELGPVNLSYVRLKI